MNKPFVHVLAAFVFTLCFGIRANAATHVVGDITTLPGSFFFEGDAIALPAGGTYKVMGDAIATLSGNVVTAKKSGFTLVSDGTTNYRLNIAPVPQNGGDVFFIEVKDNSATWTGSAWTKATSNSVRTYPNDANDIAMILGTASWWHLDVNANVSAHGVCLSTVNVGGTLRSTKKASLTLCGAKGKPAYFRFSQPSSATEPTLRIGIENGTGDNLLSVAVASPVMEMDFCGDSASADPSFVRKKITVQICSAAINIPAGSRLDVKGRSATKDDAFTKGGTAIGRIAGTGTIRNAGVPVSLQDLFYTVPGETFAGTLEVAHDATVSTSVYQLPESVAVGVLGKPRAGRNAYLEVGQSVNANPGVNILRAPVVALSGGRVNFMRDGNQNAAWTNSAPMASWINCLAVTNDIAKLRLEGDNAFYNDTAYGVGRVRRWVNVRQIERTDDVATLTMYGFDFRSVSWVVNNKPWADKVQGPAFSAVAVGKDRGSGDSANVYKIIPWVVCTANDNNYGIYNDWGSEQTFPAVSNGVLVMMGRTSTSLSSAGEYDNVYFNGKGNGISADKTINSFAYNTSETIPFPANLVIGAGRTLTITSGGMIFCRNGRWFGATQPTYFEKSGTVKFGGERAYVFSDHGIPGGTTVDWNAMWAAIVATNGLVKGGCGELVFAADQRGIDHTLWVNGGTLWLGHPGAYRQTGKLYADYFASNPESIRGCATDVTNVTLRPGTVLGIPKRGYDADSSGTVGIGETALSEDAVLNLYDNDVASAMIEIAPGADQTCAKLYVNGKAVARGTYGASGSGAPNIDDAHFAGAGVLAVRKDDIGGFAIVVR